MRPGRAGVIALAFLGCTAPADALDPARAPTQYMHDAWRPEQGLPQSSVLAMTQTHDGYLWLGTQEGLVRFDGVRFTVYDTRNTPAMAHNLVRSLMEDRAGRLWIGTDNGLLRYEHGRFTRFAASEGLPHPVVSALAEDGAGHLWVGTWGGLTEWRDEHLHGVPGTLPGREVRALAVAPDGALWIATERGLVRRSGETLQDAGAGLRHHALLCITRDATGTLWIGTEGGGVYRVAGSGVQQVRTREGLSNVWSILRDRQGNLWIGTENDGLVRLFESRVAAFGTREGLTNATVSALLEDREGNLWVGTHGGGLNRLRDGRLVPFTTREGLSNDNVVSILEGRDALWLGTYGGGLNRVADGRVSVLDTSKGLLNDFVLSLLEDRHGALWIGTNGGLNRLQGGRLTAWRLADGLVNDSVHALLEDREGAIWIGTNGGVHRLKDGRLTAFTSTTGLTNDSVWALHQARDGTILVATLGGLNRWDGTRWLSPITTKEGLSSDAILSFHEDGDGTLWVGTHGGGLNRIRGGRVAAIAADRGLFEDSVFRILDDGAGRLWMSSNKGISSVARGELEAVLDGRRPRVAATSYGMTDGMRIAECNGGLQPAGWKTRDGRMWFPTVRGAIVVDPGRLPRNTLPPPVAIEQLTADGRALDPAAAVLPPGTRALEVQYTALSLRTPDRVRFRYRLEGFDPDWIDAGSRRTAYYTNVPHGDYRFRVIAANDDGVWNEQGASTALRVEPRLRERTGFRLVAALLAAAALYAAWRGRLRQLRARERELEAIVDERTHSLRAEKERAEAASRVAEEADALKTELLAIAAHDLKSPLQSIVGAADLIRHGFAAREEQDELLDTIHRSGGRMVRLIDDLLTTAALDVGRLELQKERLDLRDVVRETVHENTRRADAKQQQIVLSFDGPCPVDGDTERLREVLDNLISNALKFSPPGATIWVETAAAGDRVLTSVRDSGPGLAAEDVPRLFEKFQRLSSRPTGGERSSGLGLSIVRRLTELHGGRVWAESDGAGRGSRFVVELPRAPG